MSVSTSGEISRLARRQAEALMPRINAFAVRAANGVALALAGWVVLNALEYYDKGWLYLLLGLVFVLSCYSMGLANFVAAVVVGLAILYVSPGVSVWYAFFLLFLAWVYAERQQLAVLLVITPALFHVWSLAFLPPLLQGTLFRAPRSLLNGAGVFACIAVGALLGSTVFGGLVATGYEPPKTSGEPEAAPLSLMIKPAEVDILKDRIHTDLTSILESAKLSTESEEPLDEVVRMELADMLDNEVAEGRLDASQRPIIERRIIREMKVEDLPEADDLALVSLQSPTSEKFPHLEWLVDLRPEDIAEDAAKVFRTVFEAIIGSPLPLVQFLLWAVAAIVVAQGMGVLREAMESVPFSSLIKDLLSSALGLGLGILILWFGYVWMMDAIFGFEEADRDVLGMTWWHSLVVALGVVWGIMIYQRVPLIGGSIARVADAGRRWWRQRSAGQERE